MAILSSYSLKLNTIRNHHSLLSSFKSLHWADWAMIFFFASRFFTSIFTSILGTKGIYITMVLLAVVYFVAMIYEWKNNGSKYLVAFFILIFSITLIALVTMTFNQEAKEWMLSFDKGIITKIFDVRKSVFAAFVILLVRDTDRILKNLVIATWLSFSYLIVQTGLFLISGSWKYYYILEDTRSVSLSYNLSFGYEMVFVSVVFLAIGVYKRKPLYFILGVFAFIFAFILGSRGAVLPILTFSALLLCLFIWNSWEKINRKLIVYTFITILIIGSFVFILTRMNFGEDIAFTTGIRNVDMLISSNFADDNGRSKIWAYAIEGISQKFPLGYGMYGDRPIVGQRFPWGYSHNIVLELIISFGIFGVFISLFLLFLLIKYFFGKSYNNYRVLLLIFISMNSKLLISDSFWFYDFFWALVGILIVIGMESKSRFSSKMFDKINEKLPNRCFISSLSVLMLLVAANLILFSVVLRSEISNQEYSPISFDKPSVVIVLQDMDIQAIKLGLSVINEENSPVSVFVEPDKMINRDIVELEQNSYADVHLALGVRSLGFDQAKDINSYVDNGFQSIQSMEKKRYLSLSTLSDEVSPDTIQKMRSSSDALLLKSLRFGNYYYDTVKQEDLYKLNSMNASINDSNYKLRMEYVKSQIDLARENEGLIIMYFRNLRISPVYIGAETTYTKFEFYEELIDYLQTYNFEFYTMSELLGKTYIPEDERTLKNLIMNSDIYRKLR